MINRIAIKEAFDDALKKSKEEYENNVMNTLENYIDDGNYFTIEELCHEYNYAKYSSSYIREVILQNLKDIYTGIKEDIPSDVEIVKYQNKFVQGLINSFDFKYRPSLFMKYKKCYDFADNDIFSQRELLKYEECLKDKEKIEKTITKMLINSAKELNKTCEIALKDVIPSTKRRTDDWMIIIIYNYIVRDIFKQSKLLFETLSKEEDVEAEIERQREIEIQKWANDSDENEKEKKRYIKYSGYKYKVLGFV